MTRAARHSEHETLERHPEQRRGLLLRPDPGRSREPGTGSRTSGGVAREVRGTLPSARRHRPARDPHPRRPLSPRGSPGPRRSAWRPVSRGIRTRTAPVSAQVSGRHRGGIHDGPGSRRGGYAAARLL